MESKAVTKVDMPDFNWVSGKVRDRAVVSPELGLMAVVATDRISAFDTVLPTPIPGRGIILNQLSNFWKNYLKDVIPNDIVSADHLNILPYFNLSPDSEWQGVLAGRTVLARVAEVVPVECIVRGYFKGSPLPKPMFTPTTKAVAGHDENLNHDQMIEYLVGWISKHPVVGRWTNALTLAQALKSTSLAIYMVAFKHAWTSGIAIIDTKFEFGFINGELTLIDEVLTPDSSRFWSKRIYAPGRPTKSFDKQVVRDWLVSSGWNKESRQGVAPKLPKRIVDLTIKRYQEAARRLMRGGD